MCVTRIASGCVPRLQLEQWLHSTCSSLLSQVDGATVLELLTLYTYGHIMYDRIGCSPCYVHLKQCSVLWTLIYTTCVQVEAQVQVQLREEFCASGSIMPAPVAFNC